MRNEIDLKFAQLRRENRKALIAYLAAGYPKLDEEKRLIKAMVESGVDIFEIGIPFSDPIADGPTIQFASQRALENGVTVPKILKWIAALKREINIPIVVMTYMNPVLAYGQSAFARDAAKAGVSGVILPDVVPEEADEIRKLLAAKNIHLIHMVAPTTPKDRLARIAKKTAGFLYAVSVAGVTGARRSLPAETKAWLANLRGKSPRPVCVGFGISGPEQIKHLRGSVDGFIVGSAVVDVVRKNNAGRRAGKMKTFVKSLSKECSNGR